MTDLLASIEGSALAVWTRESTSIWAYPTILTLHTFGLAIVVGVNAVIDVRLLGMAKGIPLATLRSLFPVVWWAFALNFVTGVVLFMSDATNKSAQAVFYVKLAMIAFALLVTRLIWKALQRDAPDSVIPANLRTLAILSLILWTAAIVSGRLLAYL
ncbi:MAG TPA: hypothetical protein VF491_21850 [Vicinamibacterales bacterium]